MNYASYLAISAALFASVPAAAVTVDMTPRAAGVDPNGDSALMQQVTFKGDYIKTVTFNGQAFVTDTFQREGDGVNPYSVGQTVAITGEYRMSEIYGDGNLWGFLILGYGDDRNDTTYFSADYDTKTHSLNARDERDATTIFPAFSGANCNLGETSTFYEFTQAATTGCVEFSGGLMSYSSISSITTTPTTITSAEIELAPIPVPALGFAYGLGLLGLAGFLRRRKA